jgi:hypothetical protein
MSAHMPTIYDVDTHGCERVRAPFRVRTELRHAPPPLQCGWREPAACTSDSVQLDSFRMTTVVSRPVAAVSLATHRQLNGAQP